MNSLSNAAKWLYGCAIAGFSFIVGSLVSLFSDEIAAALRVQWANTNRVELALFISLLIISLVSLGMLFFLGKLIVERDRLRARISELIDRINVDGRSGLSSYEHLRSLFHDFYRKEIILGRIFSILMIDIINFKEINDEMGHDVDDEVISYVGGFLKSFVRGKRDMAARYGEAADEFFLIIEGDVAALRGFTNRLRRELTQTEIDTRAGAVTIDFWASGTVVTRADRWEGIRARLSRGLVSAKANGSRDLFICDGSAD